MFSVHRITASVTIPRSSHNSAFTITVNNSSLRNSFPFLSFISFLPFLPFPLPPRRLRFDDQHETPPAATLHTDLSTRDPSPRAILRNRHDDRYRVRDIVYSMTARTTSCFGGRFTLTGEILGRRSMRASDPPPVTMEARRGSTDADRDAH